MTVSLELVPLANELDMFGSTHTSTAYSLAGHLLVTLPAPSPSFFDPRPRPYTLYIISISLVFDGKTETLSPQGDYGGSRLCLVEKELVPPSKPIVLTSELGGGKPSKWSLVFDLPVPGWLPPTASAGSQATTAYALYARVRYLLDDGTLGTSLSSIIKSASQLPPLAESPAVPWSTPFDRFGLSVPFSRPKPKDISTAPIPITITRFRKPPSSTQRSFNTPSDLVHPRPSLFVPAIEIANTTILSDSESLPNAIPFEILKGIEVMVASPQFVSVSEGTIPISMRIRTTLDEDDARGLILNYFDAEVKQVETYRSTPCPRYLTSFPIPPSTHQPPRLPLLWPHPLASVQTLGLSSLNRSVQTTRQIPLVPDSMVHFRPSRGGLQLESDWAKMDMVVPVLKAWSKPPATSEANDEEEWNVVQEDGLLVDENKAKERHKRRAMVRPEMDTTLFKIRHELRLSLHCTYFPNGSPSSSDSDSELGDEEGAQRQVLFATVPLRFTNIHPTHIARRSSSTSAISASVASTSSNSCPSASTSTSSTSTSAAASPTNPLSSLPPPATASTKSVFLPAYTELFYDNGDRKEDFDDDEDGWLPAYQPPHPSQKAIASSSGVNIGSGVVIGCNVNVGGTLAYGNTSSMQYGMGGIVPTPRFGFAM